MNNFINKIIPIALSTFILGIYSDRTLAQTQTQLLQQIEQYNGSEGDNQIEQVTNVKQLRDVSPADWSYEAVRNLSDRYNCLSGFPDGTYKGDRAITRNEFAAGLNSCFEQIERSINDKFGLLNDDLNIITENNNTESELANVGGQLDEVDSRTQILKANKFSTTTILHGTTIFGITSVDGNLNID